MAFPEGPWLLSALRRPAHDRKVGLPRGSVHPWGENGPRADENPDAAVFPAMPNAPNVDDPGEPMHGQTFLDHVNRIAERSEMDKNVYPHLFRHTAITRMVVDDVRSQKIKRLVDWDPDSSQYSIYETIADELTNDTVREHYGGPTSASGIPVIGRPTSRY